jgi:outer membrane protein
MMTTRNLIGVAASASIAAFALLATPAQAIDGEGKRYRVGVGAQLVPSYPGADDMSVRPMLNVDWQKEGEIFEFEAPDEGPGMAIVDEGGFAFGPSFGFEGARKAKDVGAPLEKVDFTFEAGAFAQYYLVPSVRLRAEVRKGLGGHKGWIGTVGADYVARDQDEWLFSIGPRVTFSDGRYHRAYFGVTPEDAVAANLPVYRPDGGVMAYGAVAGLQLQFSEQWGLFGYGKYDRLTRDAADSPIVQEFGSRSQLSGGLGISYSWGAGTGD